jgi:D-alanyl-D-alanine carboxypeptidase/D-alanyl-D-alanine-endopeptidase (penicillin-binding protein 4)
MMSALLLALLTPGAAALDLKDLEKDLDQAMQDSSIAGADVGAVVWNLQDGAEIWSYNPDNPINPASCQKAITTLVALDTLGPAHSRTTEIRYTGELKGGVLEGDVYIVGDGDPQMVIERWWKLATDLKASGVDVVKGDLVLDASIFGEPETIPGWPGGDDGFMGPAYEAPISGLMVNYNSVAVEVGPGDAPGAPARVSLEVPTGWFHIDNQAITTTYGGQQLGVKRIEGPEGPTLLVTGQVAMSASPRTFYRNVADPLGYAGTVFAEIYTRWGGVLEGQVRAGVTPDGAELLTEMSSRPLWQLIGDMNKYSSNQIAETLLRVSAAETLGDGSAEGAVELTRQTLDKYGIDATGAVLFNGSGLTREGRVTPRQLAGVFQALYTNPEWRYEAMTSMAVYGRDGTVSRRLRGTPVADQARVKTGSVAGVLTLSGVVECKSGEALAFALMFQDLANAWRPTRVWDKFVASLYDTCGED